MGIVPKHSEESDSNPDSGDSENEDELSLPRFQNPKNLRMITHMSHPRGKSVNSYIPEEFSKVQYQSFQRAIQICIDLGPGCYLEKADIKSAFKNLPIRREDLELLGCMIEGDYFFDTTLVFGLASSCRLFEDFQQPWSGQ